MSAGALVVGSFLVMEAVSYAAHRWVMHGFAMGWHRSHHLPPRGAVERNDLFPVCFSAVGVLLFAGASAGLDVLWWVGIGVAAYGACYLFVHDVYIHRRLPLRAPPLRYLEWLRTSHRAHHATGGEPYGMLLPVRRGEGRERGGRSDPLDRAVPRSRTR